tara:strand:- start:49 stop:1074 length:1026 start_codon:yes stop_codon:yes gene_type:complete
MPNDIELFILLIIIIILITISLVTIVELKYHLDLNDTIQNMNKYCFYNDNILDIHRVELKRTFMWNISNYLFDFNQIEQNLKKIGELDKYKDKFKDIDNLNRDLSIVDGKFNIMKVYNTYLHYSLPLFIFIWIYFIIHLVYIKYFAGSDYNKYVYIFNSIIFLFIYVAIYTILFSIILKKITEIYADTKCYEYIMILKELDIIIKEENPDNIEIIKILKSDDSNVKGIEDIVLTEEIISRLTEIKIKNDEKGTYIANSNNYKITLENIDKFYLYNSKNTLDRIFDEINDVTKFMYVYIILLIVPIIVLSQVLKESYIYYIFGFIIIFSFSVTLYNINNILQ